MAGSRSPLAIAAILLIIGAVAFSRFAAQVRAVEAVGLTGAGFAVGIGVALLIFRRQLTPRS